MIVRYFKVRRVLYDELSSVTDGTAALAWDSLKEDMLQVEYPENILLDVGWYPSFDPEGTFQVRVVKDFQWDVPEAIFFAKTIGDLALEIAKARGFICEGLKFYGS